MKKIVFSMVVLMLAMPVWAGVTITAANDANIVTISYVNTEPNHVRAFALDVYCSNDANIAIVDINDAHYRIYPGSIDINSTTGVVDNNGTPVCYKSDYTPGTPAYDGTLLGPPDPNMTLEMGSLYAGGPSSPNAPPSSGWLIKFSVNKSTCITLTENAIRGGVSVGEPNGAVVMENPDQEVDVNLVGCCVEIDTCNQPCQLDVTGYIPGTPDDCLGPEDVAWLIDIINDYPPYYYCCKPDPNYDPCLDVTGYIPGSPDDCIGPEDVAWLIDIINDYPPYYYVCVGDPNYDNCVP
jgi:hypothetical protein